MVREQGIVIQQLASGADWGQVDITSKSMAVPLMSLRCKLMRTSHLLLPQWILSGIVSSLVTICYHPTSTVPYQRYSLIGVYDYSGIMMQFTQRPHLGRHIQSHDRTTINY